MAILVTGGLGYVGSFVAHELVRGGHEVVIVDDLSEGFTAAKPEGAKFFQGSILDQKHIRETLRQNQIDSIIHLAAKTKVAESVAQPLSYYNLNSLGTLELFKMASELGVRNFIFSSTAAVYGNHNVDLVDETLPCRPENPYGRSKYFAECGLKDMAVHFPKMSVVCLRYFNVGGAAIDGRLGPRTRNATSLIKVVAETAAGKHPFLPILGNDYPTPDGTCIRDYVHVEDIARAHAKVLDWTTKHQGFEVFNIGYGRGFSVREVISTMEKVSGKKIAVKVAPRRAGDPIKVLANGAKLIESTGWKPESADLNIICRSAYDWETRSNHLNKE